mmetsp:Transcript_14676/g.36344  ORF Transcript_14676/g.36344 Transcript_14676/m.36344 type:complete len:107 (-) Transcript_14676:774-1094(-)
MLGWFGLAPFLGAYTQLATESYGAMARNVTATWAVAVPLGLSIRGLYLGHVPESSFAAITLGVTLAFLLLSRSGYILLNGTSSPTESQRGGLLDGFKMITTLLQRW